MLGPNIYQPCTDTACCWTDYEICKDQTGARTFHPISSRPQNTIYCQDVSSQCFPACDLIFHEGGPEGDPGSGTKISLGSSDNLLASAEMVQVHITVNAANVTLGFDAPESGEIVLDLFDISGRRAWTGKQTTKQGTHYDFVVTNATLPSGSYTYRIRIGDKSLATGKVPVTR
jgi:hypothetical protein